MYPFGVFFCSCFYLKWVKFTEFGRLLQPEFSRIGIFAVFGLTLVDIIIYFVLHRLTSIFFCMFVLCSVVDAVVVVAAIKYTSCDIGLTQSHMTTTACSLFFPDGWFVGWLVINYSFFLRIIILTFNFYSLLSLLNNNNKNHIHTHTSTTTNIMLMVISYLVHNILTYCFLSEKKQLCVWQYFFQCDILCIQRELKPINFFDEANQ